MHYVNHAIDQAMHLPLIRGYLAPICGEDRGVSYEEDPDSGQFAKPEVVFLRGSLLPPKTWRMLTSW